MPAHETVVLLHGLARTSKSMEPLARRLRSEGFEVLNIDYPSRAHPVHELAAIIFARLLADPQCTRASRLHFVTHSLGGILVRCHLRDHAISNLGNVVMLGPPNGGSEVVDRLGSLRLFERVNGPTGRELGTSPMSTPNTLGPVRFSLGVIAGDRSINWINSLFIPGPNDGKVSVEKTKVDGMSDHIVIHSTHPFLMTNKTAIRQTIHFLQHGAFDRSTPRRPISDNAAA